MLDFNSIFKGRVRASTFLEKATILDDGKPLDFTNYHIYRTLLDLPAFDEIVFRTARQVGKSIFLASNLLKFSFVPHFRLKMIHPQGGQMTEFSKLKLGMMLEYSPILKKYLLSKDSPYVPKGAKLSSDMLVNNVSLKMFSTAATIKLGYACDAEGVNRVRGGSADLIGFDEAQSIDLDNVLPVILPMLKSSDYGFRLFAGTPLDVYDPLSVRYESTTQHTMFVKCDSCNKYNTLMDLRQISEKKGGVLCLHCGSLLDITKGEFHPMNPGARIVGFHINRLMFPITYQRDKNWRSLLNDLNDPNTSENMFTQEVLGVPCGTSTQLLTKADILAVANGNKSYDPYRFSDALKTVANSKNLVYSIDWGGGAEPMGKNAKAGGASRTCASLWKMEVINGRSRMHLIWHKVYPVENYKHSTDEILTHITELPRGALITSDDRGGSYGNDAIYNYITNIRPNTFYFIPIQLGESDTIVKKNPEQKKLFVNRNLLVTRTFNKILLKEVVFPRDTALIEEISSHLLSEVEFENEMKKRIWRKRPGSADDFLFSMLFAMVGYNWQIGNHRELGLK